MEKSEVIEILEQTEYSTYKKEFIFFLEEQEDYNSYIDSINKFHEIYLENRKSMISNFYEEEKILKIMEENKKTAQAELYNRRWEELLIRIRKTSKEEIEQEKIEKFKKEKEDCLKIKYKIIEILNKENEKLCLRKSLNIIENEELKKVTNLILTYIDCTKEEILKEIRDNKK